MKLTIILAIVTSCLISSSFGIRCQVGRAIRAWADKFTEDDFPEKECKHIEGKAVSCQTKIETQLLYRAVEKRCKVRSACRRNVEADQKNCYGKGAITNHARVCHFCCEKNDDDEDQSACNTVHDVPEN